MLYHHYKARKLRLQRLVDAALARVAELARQEDTSPVGKRVRTVASRTLSRHQASLAALIERHGAFFSDKGD